MSKPKSKPKRVEYVTAASYEILSDERDALEGTLTDVEQNRDSWKSEALRLEQVICDIKSAHRLEIDNYHKATIAECDAIKKDRDRWVSEFNMYRSAWLREIGGVIRSKAHEIDGFVLRTRDIFERSKRTEAAEDNYRTMCEYRDQWATQSAVWEEKAKELEERLEWERNTARYAIGKWLDGDIMLNAVGHALETAQFEFELSQHFVKSWADHAKWLVDELKRAKRNMFSKLWHWFWGEPTTDKELTDYLQGKTPRLR